MARLRTTVTPASQCAPDGARCETELAGIGNDQGELHEAAELTPGCEVIDVVRIRQEQQIDMG